MRNARLFLVTWLLLAGCAAVFSSSRASAAELPLRETGAGTVFGPERFAVRLDPQTGWPTEVLCDGRAVVQAPDTRQMFDIRQDDTWVTGSGAAIERRSVERVAPDTIKTRVQAGDWTVDSYLQLLPSRRMLRRWFDITWHGAESSKIKGFWFQAGRLSLAESGRYLIPAQYPPRSVGGSDLTPGRRSYSGRSPYPVVAEVGDWSVVWMLDESLPYSDRGNSEVIESDESIRLTQSFQILGHVRPGQPQTVGDAWLWVQPNDAETALRRMREWFRYVGQVPPGDRPAWIKRVILYSFHPGGTIGSQCQDLGGFQPATDLLGHIHQLGCNAIWLLPLEDKSIYWPRDYYKFQDGLGTGEDYKALTGKAHALGMRVWQDCVPHGGSNEFPRAKEHPEWLAQNEDGSTLHYWCFDFNWPTWIDYMREVVSFYTREYDLDGFRIDACGGSKIPNWNPEIPYARASHAQAQGGLAMQRALRKAVKAIRPDGANLAEVGASIHGTVSDSTYDFSLCYEVLHDCRKTPAGEFVPRLRRWLHEQQCAEVPDLVRMRHLESHDSLRSGLWYGARPQRALMALISWIHGIPMVYHEMEDGNFDAFRRIFHVRRHVPELSYGEADYLSVQAPEGVFACLRTAALPGSDSPQWHADYAWDTRPGSSQRASIVLVNLNGHTVNGKVSLPAECLPKELRQSDAVRDLLTGEALSVASSENALHIAATLPSFGYTVLRIGGPPLPPLPSVSTQDGAAEPAVGKPSSTVRLATPVGSLLIDRETGLATAWQIGDRRLSCSLDLALPEDVAASAEVAVCQEAGGEILVTRRFGSRTLELRYSSSGGGVDVQAAWQGGAPVGAALVFHLPDAVRWQAQTAEGLFSSPFRVRHPDCDGVVGSIYRQPQGTAVLWESRLHPFGLSLQRAWVAAVSADRKRIVFCFDPQVLPGMVQLRERVGDSHGLRAVLAWHTSDNGVTTGSDELRFTLRDSLPTDADENTTGDARLRLVAGGWEFENEFFRARVARTGALAGLWRKEGNGWSQVLRHAGAYSDKGFGGGIRYAQENDVEASVWIARRDRGIRLIISGEMRGFQRFDKMPHPIGFYSVYTFGDGPAFRYACALRPEVISTADYAFLSLMLKTSGTRRITFSDGSGEFLAAERTADGERFAQLAKSTTPQRLPTDIRLVGSDGVMLRLGDLAWLGNQPDNVFMHGGDLHLAWMDGPPRRHLAGQWTGVTCSVACQDTAQSGKDPWPADPPQSEAMLRNGDFEASVAADPVLLSSGQTLPRYRSGTQAWQMPPGARYVVEDGNRCVTIHGDGESYRLIRQLLPGQEFAPGSTWRLTARMKGVGVEPGDVSWKTACLRWAVSQGGRTTYTTASLPFGDSSWETYQVLLSVPDSPEQVTVEAGLNGNRGQVWIDNVQIDKLEKAVP